MKSCDGCYSKSHRMKLAIEIRNSSESIPLRQLSQLSENDTMKNCSWSWIVLIVSVDVHWNQSALLCINSSSTLNPLSLNHVMLSFECFTGRTESTIIISSSIKRALPQKSALTGRCRCRWGCGWSLSKSSKFSVWGNTGLYYVYRHEIGTL